MADVTRKRTVRAISILENKLSHRMRTIQDQTPEDQWLSACMSLKMLITFGWNPLARSICQRDGRYWRHFQTQRNWCRTIISPPLTAVLFFESHRSGLCTIVRSWNLPILSHCLSWFIVKVLCRKPCLIRTVYWYFSSCHTLSGLLFGGQFTMLFFVPCLMYSLFVPNFESTAPHPPPSYVKHIFATIDITLAMLLSECYLPKISMYNRQTELIRSVWAVVAFEGVTWPTAVVFIPSNACRLRNCKIVLQNCWRLL